MIAQLIRNEPEEQLALGGRAGKKRRDTTPRGESAREREREWPGSSREEAFECVDGGADAFAVGHWVQVRASLTHRVEGLGVLPLRADEKAARQEVRRDLVLPGFAERRGKSVGQVCDHAVVVAMIDLGDLREKWFDGGFDSAADESAPSPNARYGARLRSRLRRCSREKRGQGRRGMTRDVDSEKRQLFGARMRFVPVCVYSGREDFDRATRSEVG